MSIAALRKTKAKRVLGLDCSTNSIAFCVFHNRRPIHWGKIHIVGSDIYAKAGDANRKIKQLMSVYEVHYVAIEAAIFVQSPQVAINLAYVYGSVIGELESGGIKTIAVPPIKWQNYIGNPPLTKEEKAKLKSQFPGKSTSWYQNKGREIRKQRTMNFFNKKWKLNLTDNDVGDSIGVSYFAYKELTSRD